MLIEALIEPRKPMCRTRIRAIDHCGRFSVSERSGLWAGFLNWGPSLTRRNKEVTQWTS